MPVPDGFTRIVPHLVYDDLEAAIAWLTGVAGFRERTAIRHTEPDGTIGRTQLELDGGLITIGLPSVHADSPRTGVSSMLYVFVEDVEAHRARAGAHGAAVDVELHTHAGDRRYQVTDPQGHPWTFAQRVA